MSELNDLVEKTKTQLTKWAGIIGGKPWGADKGKPRIYMPSRRDVKAFFEFPDYPTGDESDLLGGAKFSVYIDDCGQHANWYASQKEKMSQQNRKASLALLALHAGSEELAAQLLEADVDEDKMAAHLINGRIEDAKALICAEID